MVITTRIGTEVSTKEGVSCFLKDTALSNSDQKEFVFRQKQSEERSKYNGADIFDDIVLKTEFIRAFRKLIARLELTGTERVLEMGAGHGWASVLLKRNFPECYVVASDLVPAALHFCINYERILDQSIDEKWAFNCRDIPFGDNTFDRIFTMAAFHHFGEKNDFSSALDEMVRILKPNGKIALLYEPSTPKILYNFMYRIVNSRRQEDDVDEDIVVIIDLKKYSENANCKFMVEYYPAFQDRSGLKSQLYYFLLSKMKLLLKGAPCCVNITIEKGPAAVGLPPEK
jgi:ubiquinone/menaquinone biosynthesis C-methylase UbiE